MKEFCTITMEKNDNRTIQPIYPIICKNIICNQDNIIMYINNQSFFLSTIDNYIIDIKYLYWYLLFEWNESSTLLLENMNIVLPSSLEEQIWFVSQVEHYVKVHRHLPIQQWKPTHFNPMHSLLNSGFENITYLNNIAKTI